MTSEITLSSAGVDDLPAVRALLTAAELPSDDIAPHIGHFILAREGETLVGCVGLELAADVALFRSLAVDASRRGLGLGEKLTREMEGYAWGLGVRSLYLLTTTAEAFFQARGYTKIARSDAPPAIQATEEFRVCCPCTAVCMMKKL